MITNADDMIKKVKHEYEQDNSELTSMFFDFDVDMTKAEILFAYAQIQKDINDDYVWVNGDKLEELKERYTGNCREYLKSLNDEPDFFVRYSEGEINSSFVY